MTLYKPYNYFSNGIFRPTLWKKIKFIRLTNLQNNNLLSQIKLYALYF